MNKRGAELAIGTIVIIVLALIVLVVLVVGFTSGWSNLCGKIMGFTGGGANVDSIVQACSIACTTQSTYDYCQRSRALKFEVGGELETVTVTCQKLEDEESATNKDGDSVTLPSVELSCDIDCPAGAVEDKKTCSYLGGVWQASGYPCDEDFTSQVTDFTGRGEASEKCCKY